MITTVLPHLNDLASLATVCPVAPAGAKGPVDELTGNMLWFLKYAFPVAIAVCILLIVAGRMANARMLVGVGAGGIAVVFLAGLGFLILPGMVSGMIGGGCI